MTVPETLPPTNEEVEEQVFRLQVEEIENQRAQAKGKQREDALDDFDLAMSLYLEELQSVVHLKVDRRMAQSMATAILEDDQTITTLADEEAAARNDRNVALAIDAQDRGVDRQATAESPPDASFLENRRRLALKENHSAKNWRPLSGYSSSYASVPQAESSTSAAKRVRLSEEAPQADLLKERECTACTDTFSILDLANLSCGHEYCRVCITKLFADSMVDESLFPPRCCRSRIILEHVQMFIDVTVAAEFRDRQEELDTANRTYCRLDKCSAFISKDNIRDDIGHCQACGTTTCCICKGPPHQGADCPNDTALTAVLDTARRALWQRCYACRRLIELTYGCNHISCRCGAQFCYECGAEWHTCGCEQWSEERLLGRARQIRQREEQDLRRRPPHQEQEIQRAYDPNNEEDEGEDDDDDEDDNEEYDDDSEEEGLQQNGLTQEQEEVVMFAARQLGYEGNLDQIMANLRANHDCVHNNWIFIPGRHECEECADVLPQYIFECQQCRLRACNRCRSNRL